MNMNAHLEKVREKAVKRAKAADEVVRKSPYRAIGISLGAGTLIGFFSARHCSTKNGS